MLKEGKLIVIEGVDSSGKQTQATMINNRLHQEGYNSMMVSFPNYKSGSSFFVKKYLEGVYGEKPEDVSADISSMFFALDRYHSYKTDDWRDYKDKGKVIIADRYATSNLIHQGSKISDNKDRKEFIKRQELLEYEVLGLPKPDLVFFLNIPSNITFELNEDRKNKITNKDEKDIHERDKMYITKSQEAALEIAKEKGWIIINCIDDFGLLRSVKSINDEVMNKIKKSFK